ncbi:UNVERIFIED_CONTAM: hypothetical protein GTU68_001678 [Idotea baltica]|nr:hypothetical protein [Idotea baltica]
MDNSAVERITFSFYKYYQIENPEQTRDEFYQQWVELGVLGRVYIASEGINGQVSVPKENFEAYRKAMYDTGWLTGIRLNIAVEDDGKSFIKLKIKVRPKIVADGLNDETFDASNGGTHLTAKAFNELTEKEETVIIDMRNHYESEVGHFKGAITPDVDTFRDSLPIINDLLEEHHDKHVVMYCTGGIRCEKASAWFKHQGVEKVYQLDGGIIEYARQVEEEDLENKFIGKNFVFDRRLGERISDDIIAVCHQCGNTCDDHKNCINEACHLLFIQCKECEETYNSCCSTECKDFIALPEEEQKELRKGKKTVRNVFRKGRSEKLPFKGDV